MFLLFTLSKRPRPGWNCISTCRGHGCRVWDAVLAPIKEPHGIPWKEGWCIVSASEDSVVRIYSLQGMVLRELQGAKSEVDACCSFSGLLDVNFKGAKSINIMQFWNLELVGDDWMISLPFKQRSAVCSSSHVSLIPTTNHLLPQQEHRTTTGSKTIVTGMMGSKSYQVKSHFFFEIC